MLNAAGQAVIESATLAHLVTINKNGPPQVTVVWVGLKGGEPVSAHLDPFSAPLGIMSVV